jgi:hypothetical protein
MRKPRTHFEQISVEFAKKAVARHVSQKANPGIAALVGKPISTKTEPYRPLARITSITRIEPTRRARAVRVATPIKDA